ncbi:hypothetical protein ILUMI_15386, partial [Ignelater luminosus]
ALGKIFIAVYYSKAFMALAKNTKLFWSPKKCNQETRTELNSMRRLIVQLQKLLLVAFSVSIMLFSIEPLFKQNLAYGIWTLKGHEKLHHFVAIQQLVGMPFCGICVWSIDCMYLGFCAEIIVQFSILSHCIEELTVDGSNPHEMEIHYLNQMKALAVSDAVYFSKWYCHNFPSLKVPLLLMIQSSQNGITIKAGGLITINAGTVMKVLKIVWSACSVMRGIRQN